MEHQINGYAVVIGGVNTDIWGRPARALVPRDSNPGRVSARPGGVGRNIAHDLRLLGMDVSLIAAVGGDAYGSGILENCGALGMDMSMALILPERRSSTYLYVTDENGDMQVGIADMDIVRCLTPDFLAAHMGRINAASAVVLDANLETETLGYLARSCTAPLYADPVSTAKATRLLPALGALRAIKPNALEAAALTGESDPARAARALIAAGVRRVFVSLGSGGMIAAEGETLLRLPCENARVVNTTGAGDAATAAIVWAGLRGLGLEESARAAVKAGAITASCQGATNPALCAALLV